MRERSRWTPLRRSRARALPSLTAAVVVALIVFAPSAIAAGGDLDPSFGGDGRVTHGGTFSGTSVALQSDGKIVVAGGVLDEAGEHEERRRPVRGRRDVSTRRSGPTAWS